MKYTVTSLNSESADALQTLLQIFNGKLAKNIKDELLPWSL